MNYNPGVMPQFGESL